jgi:hypothetical protein
MAYVRKSSSTGNPGSVEFRPYGYFFHSCIRQPQWPGERIGNTAGTLTNGDEPAVTGMQEAVAGARRLSEDVAGEAHPDRAR